MSYLVEAVLDSTPCLRVTVGELLEAIALEEASIRELMTKAKQAFPNTKRRQNVINRVKTETVKWTPFPGLKVLLASASVLGEKYTDKRQRRYRANIMFRDVKFSESPGRGLLTIKGSDKKVFFEKLSFNDSVRVRCNCPDFQYRFNWECAEESPSALFGPKAPPYTPKNPEKYRGPANPSGLAGMCKHVMHVGLSLHKSGAIKLS